MSESQALPKTTEQVGSRTLRKETAQALLLGKAERIETIWKLKHEWIPYPLANAIFREAEELLQRAPDDRLPCILVEGSPNSGKTSFSKKYLGMHPIDCNLTGEASIAPVIRVEVEGPNEERLYDSILSQVHAPFKPSDKISKKLHQIYEICPRLGLRQLVLDEINTAIAGSHLRQKTFLTSLKTLANKLRITLVATGTKEATNALVVDEQIDSRFRIKYKLVPWSFGRDFSRLLASFEERLPILEASDLQEPRLARLILDLSGGRMGDIAELIMQAAVQAIRNEKEKIDVQLLADLKFQPGN